MDDDCAMYKQALLDRLAGSYRDGAWSYSAGKSPAVEPTCWAALALRSHDWEPDKARQALDWLASTQRDDGSLPVITSAESPCWATGLAVVAWRLAAKDDGARHHTNIERAVDWLVSVRGTQLAPNPAVFGHDTSLIGWPWVDGTHSWVEPTAYAVLALRAAGREDHPRARDGVRLLLDRAISGGGWNYGNTRTFEKTLRPFPGPSGVALTALTGEHADSRIEAGIAYLERELTGVRSPMSLAWGLIGLSAWGRRPPQAEQWLAESCSRTLRQAPLALHDALLLLASANRCLMLVDAVGAIHG